MVTVRVQTLTPNRERKTRNTEGIHAHAGILEKMLSKVNHFEAVRLQKANKPELLKPLWVEDNFRDLAFKCKLWSLNNDSLS